MPKLKFSQQPLQKKNNLFFNPIYKSCSVIAKQNIYRWLRGFEKAAKECESLRAIRMGSFRSIWSRRYFEQTNVFHFVSYVRLRRDAGRCVSACEVTCVACTLQTPVLTRMWAAAGCIKMASGVAQQRRYFRLLTNSFVLLSYCELCFVNYLRPVAVFAL